MGFGRDLRNSHEGLLKLQDWELKVAVDQTREFWLGTTFSLVFIPTEIKDLS